MFQIFQINRISFAQYLKFHKHPDTFIQKCDATTQTDSTTIQPEPFLRNPTNRMRTPLEKKNLVTYWPSDENDSTDVELQKDPPKAFLNQNSPYKTYTYIAFRSRSRLLQHNISCLDSSALPIHLRTPQH